MGRSTPERKQIILSESLQERLYQEASLLDVKAQNR
jgi:hypothetical protein